MSLFWFDKSSSISVFDDTFDDQDFGNLYNFLNVEGFSSFCLVTTFALLQNCSILVSIHQRNEERCHLNASNSSQFLFCNQLQEQSMLNQALHSPKKINIRTSLVFRNIFAIIVKIQSFLEDLNTACCHSTFNRRSLKILSVFNVKSEF